MAVPFLACMALVANLYTLPPRVLPSIQAVEGGRPGLAMLNRNGTEDLGVMQVNTIWLKPIAAYARLTEAEVRHRLLEQPCFNIAAAGLIMRTYLDEARGDLMTAIGNYHSHTPALHELYRTKILRSAQNLFRPPARP